eukprot:TRINITY_DN9811_c0_g1_i1.p1 TRINITY_DN9811_c0_g1~~TRINITY_DN9811_c0_g1_i1.p1  ORF type:complete len:241 (+),score=31.41 TRINITY_DN9811_c0_g1_i1:144-866(+)
MEPQFKKRRSENGGFGSNARVSEQHEWGFFQQSNGGADLDCRLFNTPEGCPYGPSCRFRHVSADGKDVGQLGVSSGGKPKPCMKFFSTSGCPFGESCHFLHYVSGGLSSLGLSPLVSLSAATSAASQRKSAGPIGDPSVTVNGYKTKLCNRFNTAEGCRFGDKCHFAHGESDIRPSNNRKATAEGPSITGPPGFSNAGSFGSDSGFNSQGYVEPNPPGVAGNNGTASYSAGPIGENVQVY